MYEKVGGKIPTVDAESEEIINNYRQRRQISKRKITPQVSQSHLQFCMKLLHCTKFKKADYQKYAKQNTFLQY